MSFRTAQPLPKKKKDYLNIGKQKSNIVPAAQHAKERILITLQQPCITLYKRTLLGREMVEIGTPGSKFESAPDSKLSYPADLLHLSKSNRTFGSATFHHIASQPHPHPRIYHTFTTTKISQ